MPLARAIQRATSITATILIGSSLCLAAMPAQACDEARRDAMKPDQSYDHTDRTIPEHAAGTRQVANQATTASATASASASASSGSDGDGDCTAESSASAEARAGDERRQDYDSATKKAGEGGCRARAGSEASARTRESSSAPTGNAGEY